ncbi:ribosome biogenesis GTPase [Mycoplasmopsis mustelae]|uniref:Small ribosomal subunit biogenesis GTPase RsgA n=1 Tax=Mycoplasmopsis mustelae TaxID=171289 RepID=A0A4R7UD59_9BACT|nr:ribosome small subunit-dependent GTPase A [Mycoplasmopsis mustelae]TDV22699.1 ribosome biogenesis GTPase [Mycoplasmopsis mustelae]
MENIYKVHNIVAGVYTCIQGQKVIKVTASGKLRFLKQSPLVGDDVKIQNEQITEICQRRNSLIRPKVANIDQIFIFMSILEPKFQSYLVDKYMSIAEVKDIQPILCISKADLDMQNSQHWLNSYQSLGYTVILINNQNPKYLQQIQKILKDKYNLFMGQSGVGKTTTLNILGKFNFQTQEISRHLGRGKHTTRVVSILKVQNGWLIDTPGFSSLELNLSQIELAQSFKIFKQLSKNCKYRSCLHQNENLKDCAIKQAVINNSIPQFRYDNYLKLLNEIKKEKY